MAYNFPWFWPKRSHPPESYPERSFPKPLGWDDNPWDGRAYRIEDFSFDICDMNGTPLCPLGSSLIDFHGVSIPGATHHRLESARFSLYKGSLASSYLDEDTLQMLRIVPFNLEDEALWGLIGKPKWKWRPDIRGWSQECSVVPVEYLLHSRRVYHNNAGTIEGIGGTDRPDNLAKKLVRYTALAGTCTDDIDGNSRDWTWGTLAVEANTSECPDAKTLNFFDEYLDKALDAMAEAHSFDWELRPTISGGAATFTLRTKYPRGGTDRSIGNGTRTPVVISDTGAAIPSAEKYRDWYDAVNAAHGPGYGTAKVDQDSIDKWGRWEGVFDVESEDGLELALAESHVAQGSTYEFSAQSPGGRLMLWLAHWYTGDLLSRMHNDLELPMEAAKANGVEFDFPQGFLRLKIRWGDKEPGQKERTRGGKYRKVPDIPVRPDYMVPVPIGAECLEGDGLGMVRDDHVHKGVIAVDGTEVPPIDGVFDFTSDDDTVVLTPYPENGTVDFSTGVAGGCYWDLLDGDTEADYLVPRTAGWDVRIRSAVPADVIWFRNDGKGTFTGNVFIGDTIAGVAADWLHVKEAAANVNMRVENSGGAVQFGMSTSGDTWAQIKTLGAISISLQTNSVERVHISSDGSAMALRGSMALKLTNQAGDTTYVQIANTTGHSSWPAGAQFTLEGVVYRWPTSVGTTGQALSLTTGSPNQLSWSDAVGYWQRTGTVLWPATAGDYVSAVRYQISSANDYIALDGGVLMARASASHKWNINASTYLELNTTYLRPATGMDLGGSGNIWGDAWVGHEGDKLYFRDANSFVYRPAGYLWFQTNQTYMRFSPGSANTLYLSNSILGPDSNDAVDLGVTGTRFRNAYLSRDLYLAASYGIIHGDGVSQYMVLMSNGVRFVPKAPRVDGWTGEYSTSGYSRVDGGSNPVRDWSGNIIYLRTFASAADAAADINATGQSCAIGSTQHRHPATTNNGDMALIYA